ncbi:tetratricopeptide repeat-containing glycosyltransferase family protein [Synechococcus sp. AH-601-N10]|nr:tetratricopeptide repeat-containing glycosyltransferase family protein [Synechococcus sp. AH-601-N10]
MTASEAEAQQLLHKALQLSASGDRAAAIQALRTHVDQHHERPEPLLLLLEWLLANPQSAEATSIGHYASSLRRPEWQTDFRVLHQRGRCAQHRGDLTEAECLYRQALKVGAPAALSQAQLAVALLAQERWADAIRELEPLLEAEPERLDLHSNQAVALLRLNRLKEALTASDRCLQLLKVLEVSDRDRADLWLNRGTVLQELGDREQARLATEQALALHPEITNGHTNLGLLAHFGRNLAQAEQAYKRSLEQNPDDTLASVNLAGVLLAQGGDKTQEGWSCYQQRLNGPAQLLTPPNGPQTMWQGEALSGPLLLVHEQGLGDSFQFIRLAQDLKQQGLNCWFQGPAKLHDLLLTSSLVERCLNETDPVPAEVASWCPLLSLPYLLGGKLSPQGPSPADGAYFKVKPSLQQHWLSTLGATKQLRVALHWQGNPDHEFALSRGRSLPLRTLEPLAAIDGIEWLSLQKGPGSEQISLGAFASRWHPQQALVSNTWGFEDTAAILSSCDLVISSDSGLAHLAGGLGRPVWLLLSWLPEWRWGLEGERTGWYECHRLYRQAKEGDWDAVALELQRDLSAAVQEHQTNTQQG